MSVPKVLVSFRSAQRAQPYLAALRSVGVDPVPCSPGVRPMIHGLRGVLLTGGSDTSPSYYGQEPQAELDEVDAERDAFELGLLTVADAVDLPALCICRGMQLLNIHRGGSLIQHLPQSARHRRIDTAKSLPVHSVRIEPGSRLAAVLGTAEVAVNSRHHQAADRIGTGLSATAWAVDDGVIEAVEDPSRRFLIGVQWHPEDQALQDRVQRRLFEVFADTVA